MKGKLSILFVSFYIFLVLPVNPAFCWTQKQSDNLKNLIQKQEKLISVLKRHYKQAVVSELAARIKYKSSKMNGFIDASKAFSIAKNSYEKASKNLNKARNLLKKALNTKSNFFVRKSEPFLSDGVTSCNQGVDKFQYGLSLFNKTIKKLERLERRHKQILL